MVRQGVKTLTGLPSVSFSCLFEIWMVDYFSEFRDVRRWKPGRWGANGTVRAPGLMGYVPLGAWVAPLSSRDLCSTARFSKCFRKSISHLSLTVFP